jgi:lipopolysaccharide/colanic/teichoic acid biosynthesis glycosyltransferase
MQEEVTDDLADSAQTKFPSIPDLPESEVLELRERFPKFDVSEALPKPHPLRFLFEVVIATILLVILSPIFLVVAVVLKLQGQGSVWYRQERIGLNDQPFQILKFRTMREDAEASGPIVCTSYGDPRITKLGALLRRAKIDELPQLVNVILGHMAFVGPRPERPYFHEQYLDSIEKWGKRTRVKPGITGLAQISAVITHEPRLKILADLAYINNRSPMLDLKIICYTLTPQKFIPNEICGVPMQREKKKVK